MNAGATWYLGLRREEVVPDVLLVGDPARVALFEQVLEAPRRLGDEREFVSLVGAHAGHPVMVVSTGIGAPALALALEELAHLGARRVVRVGTTMGRAIPLGSMILAQAAVRFEGTSTRYAPPFVPAVPDPLLSATFRHVLERQEIPWVEGLVASVDGFYTDMVSVDPNADLPFDQQAALDAWGVLSLDMETSALYVVARSRGLQALSLCAVTVRQADRYRLPPEARLPLERRLVETALEGLTQPGSEPVEPSGSR